MWRMRLRERRTRPLDALEHLVLRLPDREPTECIPVERQCRDLVDRTPTQVDVGGPLGDPEPKLTLGTRSVDLPPRPARRCRDGSLELVRGRSRRDADVEAHRDVRAAAPLGL